MSKNSIINILGSNKLKLTWENILIWTGLTIFTGIFWLIILVLSLRYL